MDLGPRQQAGWRLVFLLWPKLIPSCMFTVQAYNIIILNHACHLLLFTERTTSPDGSVHVADAIMVAFGTVELSPDSLIREPRYHETCMLRTSDASFFFNPATHGQICGRTRGTICWNTTIHKQGVVLTVRSHACWTPQLYAVTRAMCSLTPPIR